jgi:hypothetical protein
MKKISLFFVFMFLVGKAWATPDWAVSTEYSTSQQITTSTAAVCSVVVTGINVNVGGQIELQDSASGVSNSAIKLTVAAPTANFTIPVHYGPNPCNLFTSGIYLDESNTTGKLTVDLQYLNAI